MCCYILLDECYTHILFFLDCFYICKDFMESRINYNYNYQKAGAIEQDRVASSVSFVKA